MNKQSIKEKLVLTVIILVQVITCTVLFGYKNVPDTDEFYSYGLANSYKKPFLYTQLIKEDAEKKKRVNGYFTGDDFKYYLKTNDETAFCYDSVFYNQTNDTIPPLYYMILHTICSFNKEKFSWWYGFSMNLVCLVITQIFVYLLAAAVIRSKRIALLITAYWGFTIGCISCFVFVRMYAMLLMFGMIYIYLSAQRHSAEKTSWKNDAAIASVAFLGAMTHHNFLIFAFFCTLYTCIWLLLYKRIGSMFRYGFSALAGIVLSFVVFPATVSHLTLELPWSGELDLSASLEFYTILLKRSVSGLHSLHTGWIPYFLPALLSLIILSSALIFLFRDKPFVKALPARLKTLFCSFRQYMTDCEKMHPGWMILLLTGISFLIVIAKKTYFFDLQDHAIRYLYIIMPPVLILVIGAVSLLFRKRSEKIRCAAFAAGSLLLIGLLVFQHTDFYIPYLRHSDVNTGAAVSECTEDRDCILLLDSYSNIQCMSLMLENAGSVLCTKLLPPEMFDDDTNADCQRIMKKGKPFVLLIDRMKLMSDEEYSEYIMLDENTDGIVQFNSDGNGSEQVPGIGKIKTSESGIISYFESVSGCKASYYTTESTNQIEISAYLFSPSA